jgi:DNA-binding response OmpR family regulator
MRVLLVEDEERLVRAVKRVLEQEGYQVEVAGDGALAVQMAQSSPYDVMVLDLMLPVMDGIQVCRTLREARNPVPILMLTALGEVQDKVRGLDTGADDYLTKPFSFTELLARMRALLRRGKQVVEESVLQEDDLQLDLMRREARRQGRSIELTATEFRLLELLMRNAHRTLSRATIIERVWGYTFDGQDSVVDTYIHYLRAKIDKGQARKLIHTVRGMGYMIGVR